ncbi:reverse transcriptase N-terminal domain-containing protein [Nocardia sp. NPDC049707]|uniref:reverse transcriptase N-terminal domain-containing protein n=1 Tax=Nocardia sp. NPDC049707 TaxID=3154735 RepID=UPI003414B587
MKETMTTTPEPADTLDTEMVNRPQDGEFDWAAPDWRAIEHDVRRLRQRIFTATQAGDRKRVRNLQKLMLRSRANTLVSVRRVTEVNAGRKTPGIDGQVITTGPEKAELTRWIHHEAKPWTARPAPKPPRRTGTPRY